MSAFDKDYGWETLQILRSAYSVSAGLSTFSGLPILRHAKWRTRHGGCITWPIIIWNRQPPCSFTQGCRPGIIIPGIGKIGGRHSMIDDG